MEYLSNVHSNNLVRWAKDKDDVVVFSGDLTGSTEIAKFKTTFPDRFYSLGMAEQNMLSWAGGMAREGMVPFLHTFAVFLYRRAYDQLSMSIAYPNLSVKLFGFLPGVTTPGGVTHQAIEDIAVVRSIPNMTVFEMGDATDVESVLDLAYNVDGPVYIRMIRGKIPRLFDTNRPTEFNKARILNEGDDVTVFSSGICTEEAIRAVQALKEKGIAIEHLHITTLKPFNDPLVVQAIKKAKHGIITMENHSTIGGLGTCVAEIMAGRGINKRLSKIGIKDTYAHGASRTYLVKKYGLDAMALIEEVFNLLGKKNTIQPDELEKVETNVKEKIETSQLEAL
ncbi:MULTISPECIES: transketolase family protein [unclassified Oceanobacillus]|uniref:transketolase family protein n=1 Tax=unclassified Oceanobacillus TaxID=2630292 RepID=UPI00300E648A